MAEHNPLFLVPDGLIVTRSWLMDQGVNRHTVDNWIKSKQLISVARGVFKRPKTELTWQGIVCSLQRMKNWHWLTAGGLTALPLEGMTHHLSPAGQKNIHLYGLPKLPAWINKLLPDTHFIRHRNFKMDSEGGESIAGLHLRLWKPIYWPYGFDEVRMDISTPELAIFEALVDVPKRLSFEHANQLMRDLPALSPNTLNGLLKACKNVKVKRLFLWFAEKNKNPWLKEIDLQTFSMASGALGSGKRVIAKGGKLDPKYLITVPRDMVERAYG
jgi:hypothetical protein